MGQWRGCLGSYAIVQLRENLKWPEFLRNFECSTKAAH
jgi:hypothetical protein